MIGKSANSVPFGQASFVFFETKIKRSASFANVELIANIAGKTIDKVTVIATKFVGQTLTRLAIQVFFFFRIIVKTLTKLFVRPRNGFDRQVIVVDEFVQLFREFVIDKLSAEHSRPFVGKKRSFFVI